MITLTYQQLYKINRIEARKMLLKAFKESGKSYLKTAKLLGCSRNTVKKFIERKRMGIGLDDLSRRHKTSLRQTQKEIEDLVEKVRKQTNFGRVRLSKYPETKYKVPLSSNTVRNILSRRKLTKQKRGAFKGFAYYDWEKINPLEQFQVDLKEIADIRTLSRRASRHIRRYDLPRYQWTCLDVFSRLKLIAFSYQKSFTNGKCFFILVVLWLRSFGISHRLFFQTDWGEEFGGKSIGKLQKLQKELFDPLGVQFLRIRKRRWWDNGFVERTHRTDDEEFYIPQLEGIFSLDSHFDLALKWVYRFNCQRPHFGKHMNGKTPYQRLKENLSRVDEKICVFPPTVLDFISSEEPFTGHDLSAIYSALYLWSL